MKPGRLEKLLIRFVLALALVVLPLYAYKVYIKTDYTDFYVYYRAAERAAAGDWHNIYTLQDGASPFRYVPLTLPFFAPLAKLPLHAASVVWFFLQYLWFALGFLLIRRTLLFTGIPERRANWVTAASALFILRFCLDTFTIGQISSLMFLAFTLGFYAWVRGETVRSGRWLTLPTMLKIGPGIQYLLFPIDGFKQAIRGWLAPVSILVLLSSFTLLWLAFMTSSAWDIWSELWRGWVHIVVSDSTYYDASHYGSQSLKSMLLRGANSGWWSTEAASLIWAFSTLAGSSFLIAFWALRHPANSMGRALLFATGLFAYLWFMPETFKYGFTVLAIPVALLLALPKTKLSRFALLLGFLTLSFAGKDLIGSTLFFGLQRASIPFFVSFILFAAILESVWKNTRPADWLQNTLGLLRVTKLGPWERLPESANQAYSFILPVPVFHDKDRVTRILENVRGTLKSSDSLECLVVPYFETVAEARAYVPNFSTASPSSAELHGARMLSLPRLWGRGSALRHGFLHSKGRVLLATHYDQPCDGSFFQMALNTLKSPKEPEFVSANRRDPRSRFRIRVRVLPLVYGRHRLGLLFNRLVRAILGIRTTDTHSGSFVMTRVAAFSVFSTQSSPGFLSDLELFLATGPTSGIRHSELPVTIHLLEEKKFNRMLHETLSILIGLPRLARRKRLGLYSVGSADFASLRVTADDWGISPAANEGILELAQKGVIRRVSLLADGRYLTHRLAELKSVPGVELGLHFNLTYGKRHKSPGRFLLAWTLMERTSLRAYVLHEFRAQLAKLRNAGVSPSYLDGHHHIHIVPGLISSLALELRSAGIFNTRLPYDPSLWKSKRLPLALLSMFASREISKAGLSHPPRFLYPKESKFEDPCELARALSEVATDSEVIVHPASAADGVAFEYPDDYVEGRVTEYLTLRQLGLRIKGRDLS